MLNNVFNIFDNYCCQDVTKADDNLKRLLFGNMTQLANIQEKKEGEYFAIEGIIEKVIDIIINIIQYIQLNVIENIFNNTIIKYVHKSLYIRRLKKKI